MDAVDHFFDFGKNQQTTNGRRSSFYLEAVSLSENYLVGCKKFGCKKMVK